MKLRTQARNNWEYDLTHQETMCLRMVINAFPLTLDPAKTAVPISRTDSSTQADERQRLLNDSLSEHRSQLKRRAAVFLTADKLKEERSGWRLQLGAEEREFLLQLLNEIRIESWRALGEPADLELVPRPDSHKELRLYNLMQLAGFFEFALLDHEVGE